MSEFATDAEIKEALDQGRKEAEDKRRKALADKATQEIMGDGPSLESGQYPIPDPPTDEILMSLDRAGKKANSLISASNTHDRDKFDSTLREVFLDEGIVVDVKWWYSEAPGVYIPEVEPYGVTDRHARSVVGHEGYDPDEQVHHVVKDTLGTGKEGTISSGGIWTPGAG